MNEGACEIEGIEISVKNTVANVGDDDMVEANDQNFEGAYSFTNIIRKSHIDQRGHGMVY